MTLHPASVAAAGVLLAASLLPSSPCEAQPSPPASATAGASRVRITWRAGGGAQREVGQVAYRDSGVVVLWVSATQQFSIVADSITRVEFGWQRRHAARQGAVVGALAGATFGTFWVLATHDQCAVDPNCINAVNERGPDALIGGAIFGVLGGGVGALVGRARRNVWRDTVLVAGGRTIPLRAARTP